MAKRGRKPKRRIDWDFHKGTVSSAISLLLLLAGVISLLSIFAGIVGGSLNSRLRDILVNWFGFMAVFVPIILIYGGFLAIGTIRSKFLSKRVGVGLALLFIGFMGVFGSYAGLAGESLLGATAGYISLPGAFFFYLIVSIFSLVILTGQGLNDLIERLTSVFEKFKSNPFLPRSEAELMVDQQTGHQAVQEEPARDFTMPALEDGNSQFDSPSVNIQVAKEPEANEKDFLLVNPPSSPVEEDGNIFDAGGGDAELITDQQTGNQSDSRSSSPKLPFSNKLWEYPPLSLLSNVENQAPNAGNVQERAQVIEETLKAFGVKAGIADVEIGPAVTRYALNIAIGTKTSKIQSLSTDLALRLKSPSGSVRVVAPIPGTNLVGVEIPNFSPSVVTAKSIMESSEMKNASGKLSIALGHDVSGRTVVENISRWPHALVAGATGSGKSIMLNAIIAQLLFRCSPAQCRFIMIDPKLVELSQYNGIPHLLTPVVTDVDHKAVSALAWAVSEMERRYKLFANAGVRDLESFNQESGFQAEPYIVIVIDELADMMMVASNDVERYIIRLAQKSRATGIHLLLATQRPTTDIITGTIKANIPTRIAFKVTANVDSRVIIDQNGAETLIGKGDMLFVPPNDSKPRRIQGPLFTDKEITSLVNYLKDSGVEPDYQHEILEQKVLTDNGSGGGRIDNSDDKFREALEMILAEGKASSSYLQRKLSIGYTRAARIIDDLEDAGIIGQARGSKPREVLISNLEEAKARLS